MAAVTTGNREHRGRPPTPRSPATAQGVAPALVVCLLVALGCVLFALQAALGGGAGGPLTAGGASGGAPRAVAAHAWVVQPGDTLWAIALAVQPHGDIRPLVDRLSAEVRGQPLVVGQRVALP